MRAVDWNLVRDVFAEALDKPESERQAFVSSRLTDRPDLAERVLRLLSADSADSTFDGSGAARAVVSAIDELNSGVTVGRYRIIRRIGVGGMGAVYLAERADETFEKQVALKLIKGDLSDAALDRFKTERQALAQLEHPNIARLLDGGVDELGRPYVAMEYVQGLPITTYCDEKRLTIRERLDVFTKLCDAVQHAHQNLIIHRDLKPSNVLVTEGGEVKLLDFGIAKLLGPEQNRFAATETAARVLTPDYASPEQVTGQPVSTATDVYQLGAVLYELLCGLRPLDTRALTPSQFEAALLKGDIVAPSRFGQRLSKKPETIRSTGELRRVSHVRLTNMLGGDLDTIVRKAMEPDPRRRYESPRHLAEDIARYLVGLPIEARPASATYRAKKYVQRNAIGVSVTAGFAFLLVGFAISFYLQSEQVRIERDVANAERDRAEAVTDFLVETFSQANPLQKSANDVSAEDILNAGESGARAVFGEDAATLGKLLHLFGSIYRGLGMREEAFNYFSEARSLAEKTEPVEDDIAVNVSLAELLAVQRRWDEAQVFMDQLPEGTDDLTPEQIVVTNLIRSYIAKADGRVEDSLEYRKTAYETAADTFGQDSNLAVRALVALNSQYRAIDDLANIESTKMVMERVLQTNPRPSSRHTLARAILRSERELGASPELVLQKHENVLVLAQELYGRESLEYYSELETRVLALEQLDRHEEALELARKILAFFEHNAPGDVTAIGTRRLAVARNEAALGRTQLAEQEFLMAIDQMRHAGEMSPTNAVGIMAYARFLVAVNRRHEARDLIDALLELYESYEIRTGDVFLELQALRNDIE